MTSIDDRKVVKAGSFSSAQEIPDGCLVSDYPKDSHAWMKAKYGMIHFDTASIQSYA